MFSMFKTKVRSIPFSKTDANGAFEVTYLGQRLQFFGGPFKLSAQHPDAFLVKCATEQTGVYHAAIPCEDFRAFDPADLYKAVDAALDAAFRGSPIYAGCAGGIGRTGTFLAAVLKVFFPDENPVDTVRDVYLSYAVETADQRKLLASFDVSKLRRKARKLAVFRALKLI